MTDTSKDAVADAARKETDKKVCRAMVLMGGLAALILFVYLCFCGAKWPAVLGGSLAFGAIVACVWGTYLNIAIADSAAQRSE